MDDEKPQINIPEITGVTQPPNNPVDKVADFLPKALISIKENFKESVFLFIVLGYIFIAAFGHMERFQSYLGYFCVMAISITIYRIWEKILSRDIIYVMIIFLLSGYAIFIRFGDRIISWIK